MANKLRFGLFVLVGLLAMETVLAFRLPAFDYRPNFESRYPNRENQPMDEFKDSLLHLVRRGCIELGGTGCQGNNGKCCRKGNPYTGTMRKCINAGSFTDPVYKCVEA